VGKEELVLAAQQLKQSRWSSGQGRGEPDKDIRHDAGSIEPASPMTAPGRSRIGDRRLSSDKFTSRVQDILQSSGGTFSGRNEPV
jgi:hypothetical protein